MIDFERDCYPCCPAFRPGVNPPLREAGSGEASRDRSPLEFLFLTEFFCCRQDSSPVNTERGIVVEFGF